MPCQRRRSSAAARRGVPTSVFGIDHPFGSVCERVAAKVTYSFIGTAVFEGAIASISRPDRGFGTLVTSLTRISTLSTDDAIEKSTPSSTGLVDVGAVNMRSACAVRLMICLALACTDL